MRINPWVVGAVGGAMVLLFSARKAVAQGVSMAFDIIAGRADKQAKWAKEFATIAAPIVAKYKLPLQICVAQAATESGWGAAAPGGNYFGIKGKGPAGSTTVTTQEEFTPGTRTTIKDSFAAYGSTAQSIDGWCRFVTASRYVPPEGSNVGARLLWIWAAGYATASNYATFVSSVANSVAWRLGPEFAINLSPAQKQLAATLSQMKPEARRPYVQQLAKNGQYPLT